MSALAAASELVLAVEDVGRRNRSTVATVGRMQVSPNNVTTVPGQVMLWVDLRDVDPDLQRRAGRNVLEASEEIAARRRGGRDVIQTLPNGISHSPRGRASAQDIALAVEVLCSALSARTD